MSMGGAGEPLFPIVRRGYDRSQVDGYIAAHARWASEAWVRVQQLEAEVSELKGIVASSGHEGGPARANADEAGHRAAEIVAAAEARAAELSEASQRDREEARGLLSKAEAVMAKAELKRSEVLKEAEVRAGEIVTSKREHEQSAAADHDARSHIERFFDQDEAPLRDTGPGTRSETEPPPS